MLERKKVLENDLRIFTLQDCVALFKRKKRRLGQIALSIGCLVFFWQLQDPPQYKVEATFKEGVEKESGSSLKELLSGFSPMGRSESQFTTVIKSQPVLKPLVSKMGLQVSVQEKGRFRQLFTTVRDKLRANAGKPLEDPSPFIFRDVFYEGMEGLNFSLRFENLDHFTLFSSKGEVVAKGKIGEEVVLPHLRFTLAQIPQNIRFRRNYPLSISPWVQSAKALNSHLEIFRNKNNLSVYELSFSARDRFFATQVLEEWMNQYRAFLRKDHDEMDQEQITYLQRRQEQFYENLKVSFDDYERYLSENLKNRGCAGFETEVESVTQQMHEMSQKILGIHVELSRFEQLQKEDKFSVMPDGSMACSNLNEIFKEILNLKQQRDLLSVSLEQDYTPTLAQNRLEDLKEIRNRRETLETLQQAVKEKKSVGESYLFEPDQALASWASSLGSKAEVEREDFSEYLTNYIRMLTVREKILHEQFFHPESEVEELKGIDLETANALFIEYNRKLDQSHTLIGLYQSLSEDILRKDFEFSALSSVLNDPLSQKLIANAGETLLLFKDEKHRSVREGERWLEELELQKKILGEHLSQLLKAEEASSSLIQTKMGALQRARLDCINQKISVLREKASDFLQEYRSSLLSEKELLERQIDGLRERASQIPEAWRQEKWLELKVKFSAKMMDTITELVESKTIGNHLYRIESKPLNLPTLPPLALVPHIYFKTFMSAAVAAFLFFFFLLIKTIFKGFPTSSEKLKAMQMPWLGELSSFCDGAYSHALIGPDLERLRQIAFFLKRAPECKVISLIAGKGPDYTHALAENLARSSKRSLIIRCDFGSKYHVKDQPGLLQFLQNEIKELPIREGNGYSFITSGGFTPFGNEWIQSERFRKLIHELKDQYDYIFLLSRSELSSSEPLGMLSVSDRAIVTVCGEPTEFLTPFTNWGYHGEENRITFLTSRSKK